jgi:hypothetical protein
MEEQRAQLRDAAMRLHVAKLVAETNPTWESRRAVRQAEEELSALSDAALPHRGGMQGYRVATKF